VLLLLQFVGRPGHNAPVMQDLLRATAKIMDATPQPPSVN
jgi:hypothetical protein